MSRPIPSYLVLSCVRPASSCVKAEETQWVEEARCCCVCILSVTVHSGRTKAVLRRQAWSREHRILLQTGQCLCQVLPSYTQQTLCSVSPHSQLCPVWLSFSISHSLYLLSSFFCLEQVGLHWSRHLEYRWEALIPEGLRTDLCIWDHSLNCQNTKKRGGGGGMNLKETELCFKLSHIGQRKLAEYTEYLV